MEKTFEIVLINTMTDKYISIERYIKDEEVAHNTAQYLAKVLDDSKYKVTIYERGSI